MSVVFVCHVSSAFAMSLWDLQQHFLDNKNAHNALGKLIHCFQVSCEMLANSFIN